MYGAIGMDSKTLRIIGIVCLVICGICLFIAVERYLDNAGKVNAMKEMGRGMGLPSGGLLGGADIKPATPAATKYAVFFGVLSGLGGALCLWKASVMESAVTRDSAPPKEPE